MITYDYTRRALNLFCCDGAATAALSPERACQTSEPSGQWPVNLKNLFLQPFCTTRGASRAPFFKTCGGAATTTL